MRTKYRCVIWGIGEDYEKLINQVLFEEYKGNIVIEALVCRNKDRYCDIKDKYPIITKEELRVTTFDYLIITSQRYYKEIKIEALELGVPESHIINGKIMSLPFFDFRRYVKLIENPVTILADDCWGGLAYDYLGLEYSSPLINIYWEKEEFSKFIRNPLLYLESELTIVRDGNLRKGISPIGRLGNDEEAVTLKFIHNIDFEEAKKQWDRRIMRINRDNIFVKMGFNGNDKKRQIYLNSFKQLDFNKILFYLGEEDIAEAFRTERFIWYQKSFNYIPTFNYNDYLRTNYWWDFDLFKLLNGEKDYSRY